MNLHVIYAETYMLPSNLPYGSWIEMQDEGSTYNASFGPWHDDEIVEYLVDEYEDISPSIFEKVSAFLVSPNKIIATTFSGSDQLSNNLFKSKPLSGYA